MSFHVPEPKRITVGRFASDASHGNNGAFQLAANGTPILCLVSDGEGWEHVSVRPLRSKRTLTWEEMCLVKAAFWDPEDSVMQLHPPQSTWVNNHAYVLHLWRPTDQAIPLPNPALVGYRGLGTLIG